MDMRTHGMTMKRTVPLKNILQMSLYYECTSFSGDSMGYVPLVVKYFPQI